MQKKGVVELGINSIIILILALVFLGIAIIFIINIFSTDVPDAPDFPFHASADEPMVLQSNQVEVRAGRESQLRLRVYNSQFPEDALIRVAFLRCEADGEVEPAISLSSAAQKIIGGQEATYLAVVKASEEAFPNTYSCIIAAGEDDGSGGVVEEGSLSDQVYVIVTR